MVISQAQCLPKHTSKIRHLKLDINHVSTENTLVHIRISSSEVVLKLGWQILKKVRKEEEFFYIKVLDIGRICKRKIPCIGVVVLQNAILQFEQTFLIIPMPLEFMV